MAQFLRIRITVFYLFYLGIKTQITKENNMIRYFVCLCLFIATAYLNPAAAATANDCVKMGYGKEYKWDRKDKRYIKNACSRKIEVFWCHNNPERKHSSSKCGGKKFYKQHTVLESGKKKFNMYSIPDSGTIRYGACFGGYYTATGFTSDGRFRCKNR